MKKRYGSTTVTALDSRRAAQIEARAVCEWDGSDRHIEIQMDGVGAITMETDAVGRCKAIATTHEAKLHLSIDQALDLIHALGRALTAAEQHRTGRPITAPGALEVAA